MGTPRTMRSARWKREANSLIFSHVAVSTCVIDSPETPLYLALIDSASNSGSCSCQISNVSTVTSPNCLFIFREECIDDCGGRRFFLSRRGRYVQDIHFRCPSHVGFCVALMRSGGGDTSPARRSHQLVHCQSAGSQR